MAPKCTLHCILHCTLHCTMHCTLHWRSDEIGWVRYTEFVCWAGMPFRGGYSTVAPETGDWLISGGAFMA